MTGKLSKNFHGVGTGPFSKILAVKIQSPPIFLRCDHKSMLIYNDISPFKFGLNPGGEKKSLPKTIKVLQLIAIKSFKQCFIISYRPS